MRGRRCPWVCLGAERSRLSGDRLASQLLTGSAGTVTSDTGSGLGGAARIHSPSSNTPRVLAPPRPPLAARRCGRHPAGGREGSEGGRARGVSRTSYQPPARHWPRRLTPALGGRPGPARDSRARRSHPVPPSARREGRGGAPAGQALPPVGWRRVT